MPNPLGLSFTPTFEDSRLARQQGGGPPAGGRPQEALQVLSYRLPRVLSGGALSPLLSDSLRGGPNLSVLQSVMRTILGGDEADAILGGSLSASETSTQPRIFPGSGVPPSPDFPSGPIGEFPPPSTRVPRDFPPYGGSGDVPPYTEIPTGTQPYEGTPWDERFPSPPRNPFARGSMY